MNSCSNERMIDVGKHDEREFRGPIDMDDGIHPDLISSVNEDMPDEELLYDLAELYKVFGDTTRIKILYVLFEAEMCVCDIAQILNMTQSAISHQLRVLKQAHLVRSRRVGKQIYYSLTDDHVRTILGQGMDHIEE